MKIVSSKYSIRIDTFSSNSSSSRLSIKPTIFKCSPSKGFVHPYQTFSPSLIFGTFQDSILLLVLILPIFNQSLTQIINLTTINNNYKVITNPSSFYSNSIRKTKKIISKPIMIFGGLLKLMKMENDVFSWECRE